VELKRDGVKHTLTITPRFDEAEQRYLMGFYWAQRINIFSSLDENVVGVPRATVWETVQTAYHNIFFSVRLTIHGLVQMVTFQADLNNMSGIVGVTALVGDLQTQSQAQAEASDSNGTIIFILSLVQLTALLSANLGVFNLLPVPALDGGRLVFLGIEGVRRKPVSPEREGMVHFAGFVLLIVLAVFVTYNDILKLL